MSSPKLFQPLKIGNITLQNRIVMAPLTRFRASDAHVPQPMAKTYYEQRASVPGTLLITEATFISPEASGYTKVPGLWNEEQLKAWKTITDAVHAKGSYIYAQLWALGRVADKDTLKSEYGFDLKSSSAIAAEEGYPVPQELTEEEIYEYIDKYAAAAKAAVEVAGFDGVEIHGANGYLIDQFIQDVSNVRTDKWGGSVENRSRFAVEVTKAVVAAVGPERTGIRFSPWSKFQGMRMQDPVPQFTDVITKIKPLNLAYVHLVESRIIGNTDIEATESLDFAIDAWGPNGKVLLAGGFTPESAKQAAEASDNVAIAFGRSFIPNPDLVFRIKNGIELEKYDRALFYNKGSPKGYIDYPFSAEFKEQQSSKL